MKDDLKKELLSDNIHLRIAVKDYNLQKISEIIVNKDNIDKIENIDKGNLNSFIRFYNSKLPFEQEKGVVLKKIEIDKGNYLVRSFEITDEIVLSFIKHPELEKLTDITLEDAFKSNIGDNFFISYNYIMGVKTVLKDKNQKVLKEIVEINKYNSNNIKNIIENLKIKK
jgi:hypothetical protein